MSQLEADPGFRDFPMPELIAGQARAWLDTPEAERIVAEPRWSATVMLVRDIPGRLRSSGDAGAAGDNARAVAGSGANTGSGVEVFVLRRAASMAFAPGMVAFPGGGVDPRDAEPGVPWGGPEPSWWARQLGVEKTRARELVCAAAREVFEECGVLLAAPAESNGALAEVSGPEWAAERASLLDRSQSFSDLLHRRGLVLRTDLLAVRAQWTTPICEPRRYRTSFFAARMPEGQTADALTTEADRGGWEAPSQLLQAQQAGAEVLLPPTQVMVEQLAQAPDVATWLAQEMSFPVPEVRPWPVEHAGQLWMRIASEHNMPRAGDERRTN